MADRTDWRTWRAELIPKAFAEGWVACERAQGILSLDACWADALIRSDVDLMMTRLARVIRDEFERDPVWFDEAEIRRILEHTFLLKP